MKNVSRHPETDPVHVIIRCGVCYAQPDLLVDTFEKVYNMGIMVNLWSSLSGLSCKYVYCICVCICWSVGAHQGMYDFYCVHPYLC